MTYKCLKCGSESVIPLKAERFEADAIFYKDGDVATGNKIEEVGTVLSCKNCNNLSSPFDKDNFLPINN